MDTLKRSLRRRAFLKVLAGSSAVAALAACAPAAAPSPTAAPKPAETAKPAATTAPVAPVAKPLAGQTVKVLLFDHVYTRAIKEMIPEFEAQSGAKVEIDIQAFAIHNQRADLELSSASGALDVVNMTFIWSGKWIGANWATELTPLINDAAMTDKAAFDMPDFLAGAMSPFKRGDKVYALPWTVGVALLTYRTDIFQKYGIAKPPTTFEEQIEISKKIHTKEVAANIMRGVASLHLTWPQFVQSYGGKIFANPEEDMTPMLNTPEAVKASEMYVPYFNEYGVPGSVNMADADAQAVFNQGKAAMFMDDLGVTQAAIDPTKSTVADKVAFARVPGGSAGPKPFVAVHGFLIPAATKDKRKGWEFLKWAAGKQTMNKISADKNFATVSRQSILGSADFKKRFMWGGSDIGALISDATDIAAKGGYMPYRTVAEYGPIGDQMVVSIGEIVTKQKPIQKALDELQKNVIGILEQNGRKIKK